MKKSIFLTGSKGFIGRHLYEAIKNDYDVTCATYMQLPLDKYDYIVHLAATTTTSNSFIPELFDNNIVYTRQLFNAARGKVIYASSTSAAELTNIYAYTKQYAEWLGSQCLSTGLRFFNVYGPNNNKGIVKRCFEATAPIDVYGGGNIRDFIHIDDVVHTIIANLDSPSKIIEVGTGRGMTIFRALQIIEDITGIPCAKHARILAPVSSDMKYSVASKGIEGCLSFEDGIKRIWEGMQ